MLHAALFLTALATAQAGDAQFANSCLVTGDEKLGAEFARVYSLGEAKAFAKAHPEIERIVSDEGTNFLIDRRLVVTKVSWALDTIAKLIASRRLPFSVALADLPPDQREACRTMLLAGPMNLGPKLANPNLRIGFQASVKVTARRGDESHRELLDLGKSQIDRDEWITPPASEGAHKTLPAYKGETGPEPWSSLRVYFQPKLATRYRARMGGEAMKRFEKLAEGEERRRAEISRALFGTALRQAAPGEQWDGQSDVDVSSLNPATQAMLANAFSSHSSSANPQSKSKDWFAGAHLTDCRPAITVWLVEMEDGVPSWSGFDIKSAGG